MMLLHRPDGVSLALNVVIVGLLKPSISNRLVAHLPCTIACAQNDAKRQRLLPQMYRRTSRWAMWTWLA